MPDRDFPENWYRQVQGPDDRWYDIKAVCNGQDLRWDNDAWAIDASSAIAALVIGALRHPFRRARSKRGQREGGFLVGVIHEGALRIRILRSDLVPDESAVEVTLDRFEADVRAGKTRI